MSRSKDMIMEDREDLSLGDESVIRYRIPWSDRVSLNDDLPDSHEVEELLDADETSYLAEAEDRASCLSSSLTSEDEHLLDCEKTGILSDEMDLDTLAYSATVKEAEELVGKTRSASWTQCNYQNLPSWLQFNDFLLNGHRPPIPSYYACFMSIFQIHSETGNIWTHLLGCIGFIGMAIIFLIQPPIEIQSEEKLVFATFFVGAIFCMGLSFSYHTLYCHSECVGILVTKLDYCGIIMLIMGSFIPWLYYGFYCHYHLQLIYMFIVIFLSITSVIVSSWETFSEPSYRHLRAGVFMVFGLSGVIPAIHYIIIESWYKLTTEAPLGHLILMGFLYILGATIYVCRIPERFCPGTFDIWFQSHQIFHALVLAAALVHYNGIEKIATYRLTIGKCVDSSQINPF